MIPETLRYNQSKYQHVFGTWRNPMRKYRGGIFTETPHRQQRKLDRNPLHHRMVEQKKINRNKCVMLSFCRNYYFSLMETSRDTN